MAAASLPPWARDRAIRELNRRGIEWPPRPPEEQSPLSSDPVLFAQRELSITPWERQAEILAAVARHKRVTVRSCHHSGKTTAAGILTHWWTRHFEPSLVLTTAPTARQVEAVLWHQIALQQQQGRLSGDLKRLELHLSRSQRAVGLSTNEPERFQGWHCENLLVIVDEASGVAEPIYQAIEGCLTGPNAHLLLIGNPNNAAGTFYESFSSPLYEKFHIGAADVPEAILPAAWREERLEEWGADSPAYQVRVLGEFPEQGEDSLISLRWVTEAQERHETELPSGRAQERHAESVELSREEPGPAVPGRERAVELGADIARYGGDESVLYVRRGDVVVYGEAWRAADTMASAGRIASAAQEWGARLVKVDEIGIGAGVLDRLRELDSLKGARITVTGVNVGESASDSEHYANRRSEIFWGLRERFKQGEISIPKNDTLLLDQLVALKFSYTSRGQIKLESKEDMRKNRSSSASWQSPDRADALALAYCKPTGFRARALAGAPRRAR